MAIVDPSHYGPRIADLVQVLEALGDRSRLLIVSELRQGPMSVGEIVGRLPVAQSTISVHLSVLQRSGLVSVEVKRNRRIDSLQREYRTADDCGGAALCRRRDP